MPSPSQCSEGEEPTAVKAGDTNNTEPAGTSSYDEGLHRDRSPTLDSSNVSIEMAPSSGLVTSLVPNDTREFLQYLMELVPNIPSFRRIRQLFVKADSDTDTPNENTPYPAACRATSFDIPEIWKKLREDHYIMTQIYNPTKIPYSDLPYDRGVYDANPHLDHGDDPWNYDCEFHDTMKHMKTDLRIRGANSRQLKIACTNTECPSPGHSPSRWYTLPIYVG
ncbi:hypothetical protein SLS60_008759 [Paraconiothyrium brasiliense]|uniref:Uncharacterized protein n=1 Tax=Paraconiothyrium brasiliense TaxID=300254 RepID=A0ABR3QZJ5_9PLEO